MTDFGFPVWWPFVLLGFLMTVGYVIWRWKSERAKRRRDRPAPVDPRRQRLEDELRAELDKLRAAPPPESPQPGPSDERPSQE